MDPLLQGGMIHYVQTGETVKKNNKEELEVLVFYFSCNIPVLSETSIRKLPEGEGTPCSKQILS